MIYTTKTGAEVLGVRQDTLKHYALRFNIGIQPGGPRTPWLFTKEDLLKIRNRAGLHGDGLVKYKSRDVEAKEDREELGLGALYNEDFSPRS
jgi:hypothetical protein